MAGKQLGHPFHHVVSFYVHRISHNIEGCHVYGQKCTVPVVNFTPYRGKSDKPEAVVGGKPHVGIRIDDLEIIQSTGKEEHGKQDAYPPVFQSLVENGAKVRHRCS